MIWIGFVRSLGVLLRLRDGSRETGVVAAGFLKHLVLRGTKLAGGAVEHLGHLNGAGGFVNLHLSHLEPLLSGALPRPFYFLLFLKVLFPSL